MLALPLGLGKAGGYVPLHMRWARSNRQQSLSFNSMREPCRGEQPSYAPVRIHLDNALRPTKLHPTSTQLDLGRDRHRRKY